MPDEGSSWGGWCPSDFLVVDHSHRCRIQDRSPEGCVCPGHLLVCDLPASVAVRTSHLGVSVCPGGGTCNISSRVCLVTGATHCGAGTNIFWLWLVVMGKIGFDVVYDITLVHIRNCLLLLMPKAKLFTSTQLISGTLKNQLIHIVKMVGVK